MKIKNIEGLSAHDLQKAVNSGARFVYYTWIISVIIVTFKRTSGVYLVRGEESRVTKGFIFILVSVLFGWWGIPFGPKHTIESIRTNMSGGKDVTEEVMAVVVTFEDKVNKK
jgi:hypothetical protein